MQREKVQPSGTQLTVLRANAFHALARAYMPPDTWPEDFPEMIETAFSPLVEAVSGARELLRVFESGTLGQEKLAPLHARLFIGPFDIQAPPWASLYLDPEKKLMGKSSRFAAEAYAEAGLSPAEGPSDAPDHITHELEFMYFLAYQEYSTGEQKWRIRQQRFWEEHLGSWLPQFAGLVKSATDDSTVYAAIADATVGLCDWLEDHDSG